MPNPIKIAAYDNRPGLDRIDVTPDGADVDLTDPEGPTAGWCARNLFITGAGDVKYLAVGAPGQTPVARTETCTAGQTLNVMVQKVYDTGTDATDIIAVL